jgi:hypothetical protein
MGHHLQVTSTAQQRGLHGCRQKVKATACDLGQFYRRQCSSAKPHPQQGGSARGGADGSNLDLLALLGRPQRTMTLHHKALKHVDGSLTAADKDAEDRWVTKVRHCTTTTCWVLVVRCYALREERRSALCSSFTFDTS